MLGAEIRPILGRLRLPEPLVSLMVCAIAPVELVFGTANHYSSTSAVAVGRGANEVKQKAAKIAKKRISNMGSAFWAGPFRNRLATITSRSVTAPSQTEFRMFEISYRFFNRRILWIRL